MVINDESIRRHAYLNHCCLGTFFLVNVISMLILLTESDGTTNAAIVIKLQ